MILYAIPTPLGAAVADALPASSLERVKSLRDFAVENAKSARAFLAEVGLAVRELNIQVIAEDTSSLLNNTDYTEKFGTCYGFQSTTAFPSWVAYNLSSVPAVKKRLSRSV